jgi:hypothetical protein
MKKLVDYFIPNILSFLKKKKINRYIIATFVIERL